MIKKIFALSLLIVGSQILFGQGLLDEIDKDFQAGRWLVAAEKADKHVDSEEGKNSPQAWYQRGIIYQEISKSNDPGFTMEVSHTEATHKSAESYTESKKLLSKTDALLPAVNRKIEEGWKSNYNTGVKNYRAHNYFDSFRYFEMALVYKPTDHKTRRSLAHSASKSMKYDHALEEFEKLAHEKELDESGYKSLIYAAKKTGKHDSKKVLAYLDMAIETHPHNSYFRQKKTQLLIKEGLENKAIKDLENNISEYPKNPDFYFQLANLYGSLMELADDDDGKNNKKENLFKKSEEYYLKGLKLDDENFIGNYNYGVMLHSRGQDFYQQYNQKGAEARAKDKAQRLIGEGNKFLKKGLPYIEKARLINPGDKAVKETLALFYEALGEHTNKK